MKDQNSTEWQSKFRDMIASPTSNCQRHLKPHSSTHISQFLIQIRKEKKKKNKSILSNRKFGIIKNCHPQLQPSKNIVYFSFKIAIGIYPWQLNFTLFGSYSKMGVILSNLGVYDTRTKNWHPQLQPSENKYSSFCIQSWHLQPHSPTQSLMARAENDVMHDEVRQLIHRDSRQNPEFLIFPPFLKTVGDFYIERAPHFAPMLEPIRFVSLSLSLLSGLVRCSAPFIHSAPS